MSFYLERKEKKKKRNRSTDFIKEFQMWNADYLYQK